MAAGKSIENDSKANIGKLAHSTVLAYHVGRQKSAVKKLSHAVNFLIHNVKGARFLSKSESTKNSSKIDSYNGIFYMSHSENALSVKKVEENKINNKNNNNSSADASDNTNKNDTDDIENSPKNKPFKRTRSVPSLATGSTTITSTTTSTTSGSTTTTSSVVPTKASMDFQITPKSKMKFLPASPPTRAQHSLTDAMSLLKVSPRAFTVEDDSILKRKIKSPANSSNISGNSSSNSSSNTGRSRLRALPVSKEATTRKATPPKKENLEKDDSENINNNKEDKNKETG